MSTKVTILGNTVQHTTPKRIEFCKFLTYNALISNAHDLPESYDNIELITLNYTPTYDLMFAYSTDRSKGVLYLGKFNDGVVF